MRTTRPLLLLVALSFTVFLAFAQQSRSTTPSVSDPQAVAYLQQSVSALGNAPLDSTATGSVTITAGSLTTHGTVTILTRGTAETSIQFQMPNLTWSVIYANEEANRVDSGVSKSVPLELVASSRCIYFPQPYLADLLKNPDVVFKFAGNETVDSVSANHIHAQNTFASSPLLRSLAEFNTADIWLDSASGLPLKIAMIRRYAGGSAPKIPISITYSNYQTVSGVRYPFTIKEYVTETLWSTTTIQSVTFNTGLTDANFPVTGGGN